MSTTTYPGHFMLLGLARRAQRLGPAHIEVDDLVHAGWLCMNAALQGGKTWGYARIAAHGAMIEEIRRWFGTPHRASGQLRFVQLSDRHSRIPVGERLPGQALAESMERHTENLPPRQQQCVALYSAGYSLTEIGREYGISPSNVLAHLRAGTANLKKLLAEHSETSER